MPCNSLLKNVSVFKKKKKRKVSRASTLHNARFSKSISRNVNYATCFSNRVPANCFFSTYFKESIYFQDNIQTRGAALSNVLLQAGGQHADQMVWVSHGRYNQTTDVRRQVKAIFVLEITMSTIILHLFQPRTISTSTTHSTTSENQRGTGREGCPRR